VSKPVNIEKGLKLVSAGDADMFHIRRFFGDADADWLAQAVNAKTHFAHCIAGSDGVNKYLVVWHRDAQKRLFVNCVVEQNGGGNFEMFSAGLKEIARTNGCIGMTGNATRDGLVKRLISHGWTVKGITVEYDF
jgi:hypothetical protein